jgi:hypothetical protein
MATNNSRGSILGINRATTSQSTSSNKTKLHSSSFSSLVCLWRRYRYFLLRSEFKTSPMSIAELHRWFNFGLFHEGWCGVAPLRQICITQRVRVYFCDSYVPYPAKPAWRPHHSYGHPSVLLPSRFPHASHVWSSRRSIS